MKSCEVLFWQPPPVGGPGSGQRDAAAHSELGFSELGFSKPLESLNPYFLCFVVLG